MAIAADNKKSFCLHAEVINNSFSFAPATRIDARLCSRPLPWLSRQTVGCVTWRLTDNQARHARPLHGSQAQMLMLLELELLLELLLLLLLLLLHVLTTKF